MHHGTRSWQLLWCNSTLPPSSSVGRGDNSGGRFAPPVASNVPPIMTNGWRWRPNPSLAPPLGTNTRGRGSRGGGRFYDSSGRGRRGRGRYSSSRGRGRMPQEARGFGATDTSSQPPWAAQSHDTTGWNYERNPSFEASRNNSNNTEWNNNAPNQGGAPMEVDSTNSSDWAGRDRDWNNSNTAASQAVLDGNDGTQANWNNQDSGSNWSSYRGGGSNLQDSLRGGLTTQPTAPPPSRASTRSCSLSRQIKVTFMQNENVEKHRLMLLVDSLLKKRDCEKDQQVLMLPWAREHFKILLRLLHSNRPLWMK